MKVISTRTTLNDAYVIDLVSRSWHPLPSHGQSPPSCRGHTLLFYSPKLGVSSDIFFPNPTTHKYHHPEEATAHNREASAHITAQNRCIKESEKLISSTGSLLLFGGSGINGMKGAEHSHNELWIYSIVSESWMLAGTTFHLSVNYG